MVLSAIRHYSWLEKANGLLVDSMSARAKSLGIAKQTIASAAGVSEQALGEWISRAKKKASNHFDVDNKPVAMVTEMTRSQLCGDDCMPVNEVADILGEIRDLRRFHVNYLWEKKKLGFEALCRGAGVPDIVEAWGMASSTVRGHLKDEEKIRRELEHDLAYAVLTIKGMASRPVAELGISEEIAENLDLWLMHVDGIIPLKKLIARFFSDAAEARKRFSSMPEAEYERIERYVEHQLGRDTAHELIKRKHRA